MTIRVGIAGMRRGYQFLRHLSVMKDVRVTGFVDPDAGAFQDSATFAGIARYAEYEDLLDSGIDAVVIATPMPLHAAQTIAAFRRGIHVLCEVGAAVTLDECRLLVQAAADSRSTYMSAENFCYFRENVAVRNMAHRGVFGQLYYAEGEYIASPLNGLLAADANETPNWRRSLLLDRRGCMYGTHSLGPILTWLDDALAELACFGSGNHTEPACAADNTAIMMGRSARCDALIKVRVDLLSFRPNHAYFALQGTEGCYEAPRSPGDMHKVALKESGRTKAEWRPLADGMHAYLPREMAEPPPEARSSLYGGADYFMIKDFVDCLREGKPSPIGLARALDFAVPCIVSAQSIEPGSRTVPVPRFM